jgi:hypothetical protein
MCAFAWLTSCCVSHSILSSEAPCLNGEQYIKITQRELGRISKTVGGLLQGVMDKQEAWEDQMRVWREGLDEELRQLKREWDSRSE